MTNHKHKTKPNPQTVGAVMETAFTDEPTAPVGEWPNPVVHLNYPGYHLNQVGQIRGPMYTPSVRGAVNDQLLTVVSESYDTATHSTRHGLTYGIHTKRVPA